MQKIEKGSLVTVAYSLSDLQGQVIEAVSPDDPLDYIHGEGTLLPKIEDALEGKTEGFSSRLRLNPEEGFGPFMPELVVEAPLDLFPEGAVLEPGMKFNTRGPGGEELTVQVLEVHDNMIVVDGNHPLAGLDIEFDITVLGVRPPGSSSN